MNIFLLRVLSRDIEKFQPKLKISIFGFWGTMAGNMLKRVLPKYFWVKTKNKDFSPQSTFQGHRKISAKILAQILQFLPFLESDFRIIARCVIVLHLMKTAYNYFWISIHMSVKRSVSLVGNSIPLNRFTIMVYSGVCNVSIFSGTDIHTSLEEYNLCQPIQQWC